MDMIKLFLLAFVFSSSLAFAGSTGTGFFVSNNGHLITNAHVVEGADNIFLRTADGQRHQAQLVTLDRVIDLAILKIDASSKPLFIGLTQEIDKGTKVYTLGFPDPELLGFKESKYAEGVVSSFSGSDDNQTVMQVSTPLQPGNSGGPILLTNGTVIGVVRYKLDQLNTIKEKGYLIENVSFAIKSDYLKPFLETNKIAILNKSQSAVKVRDIENSIALVIATQDKGVKVSRRKSDSPEELVDSHASKSEASKSATLSRMKAGNLGGFEFSTYGSNELEYSIVSDDGDWKTIKLRSGQELNVYKGLAIVYQRSSGIGEFNKLFIDELKDFAVGKVIGKTYTTFRGSWAHTISIKAEEYIETPVGYRKTYLIEHVEQGLAGNNFHELVRTWVDSELQIPWKREVERLGGRPSERTAFRVILIKAP